MRRALLMVAGPAGLRATYSEFVASLERAFIEFRAGKSVSAVRATATAQSLAPQLGVPGCGQIMPGIGGY